MTDNQTLIGKSLKYFNQAYAPFVYKAFIKEYHESALEVLHTFGLFFNTF